MAAHFWRLIDLPLVEIVLAGVLATKPDDQRKDDFFLRAEDRPLRFYTARVKNGKARSEHIPSGLPPRADIVDALWHFRFVPNSDIVSKVARPILLNVSSFRSTAGPSLASKEDRRWSASSSLAADDRR